jgi:hypothetical protein
MNKLFSLIIGENPKITANYQPASKRKIALYANCIMVPVILWFINSYLLVKEVMGGSLLAALTTGFIAAILVFIIERSVVMSNGSKSIATFRVLLGLIIACLGSLSMDEIVFKNDIDQKMSEYKLENIQKAKSDVAVDFKLKIDNQQSIVNQTYADWQKALYEAMGEADGTKGSGKANVGPITKMKFVIAAQLESVYNKESQALANLKSSETDGLSKAEEKAISGFTANALLIRIRAMFDLIAEDSFMLVAYILFTLLLFLVEFLVVIIKMCSKKSIDEELEKMRDEIIRKRALRTLEKSELFYKPENSLPVVLEANRVLQKPSTANLN